MNQDRLRLLNAENDEVLAERWFNIRAAERYPEIRDTAFLLIGKAREQVRRTGEESRYAAERGGTGSAGYLPYLAGAMMFYSAMETGNYDNQMREMMLEEEKRRAAANAGSSLSSDGGGSSYCSGRDGQNGNGGSDGNGGSGDGGSNGSTSSCGSSCGST